MQTGLLALQGEDEHGRFIRSKMKKLKVRTDFIKGGLNITRWYNCNHLLKFIVVADKEFSTSQVCQEREGEGD